jgi:hypothetical protein
VHRRRCTPPRCAPARSAGTRRLTVRAGQTSSRYSSTRRLVRPGRPDRPTRSSAVRSDGWVSGTGRPSRTRYRRRLVPTRDCRGRGSPAAGRGLEWLTTAAIPLPPRSDLRAGPRATSPGAGVTFHPSPQRAAEPPGQPVQLSRVMHLMLFGGSIREQSRCPVRVPLPGARRPRLRGRRPGRSRPLPAVNHEPPCFTGPSPPISAFTDSITTPMIKTSHHDVSKPPRPNPSAFT